MKNNRIVTAALGAKSVMPDNQGMTNNNRTEAAPTNAFLELAQYLVWNAWATRFEDDKDEHPFAGFSHPDNAPVKIVGG